MENTLFIALSQQMVLRRQMSVIANNIANASTAGYKGEHMLFAQYVTDAGDGQKMSLVQDIAVVRDYREGSFTKTGNPLDVAIHGRGWFAVETEFGERYTRDGQFKLNAEGVLIEGSGNPVLGEGDTPIVFQRDDRDITIAEDGTITASGQPRGRLKLVQFEDEYTLNKISRNLYEADQPADPAEGARLAQGLVEGSNVEPIIEMATMIEVARAYQGTQKMIDGEHDRQRQAIEALTQES